MEGKKYRAIKYIRLSDADGNFGESDSITNQRRLIDEFVKKHPDIEIVDEKIDDGYTGINYNRPAFEEMMDLIKAGKVNCCITKDLSRLGREYIETGKHLRDLFPKHGCRFIAINDNIDTLTDNGDDIDVTVKMIMNDSYSLDTSQKTRSALASKRNSGEHVGAFALYGYIKSDENRNKLVIDEHAASVVREIFDMKIEGFSNIHIARILNERGELSPVPYKKEKGIPYAKNGYGDKDDAKWSVITILRILKNETYTGTLVQGIYTTPNYKIKTVRKKPQSEWSRFENAHEAIIDKNKFDLVQRIMQMDTKTSPHENKLRIFSGLLMCGSCGKSMSPKAVPYKGTDIKYNYYYCPTTKKRGCKAGVWFKEDELTELVLKQCNAHLNRLASLDRFMQKLDADKVAREHADRLSLQLKEKERRLQELHRAQGSLYKDKANSIITQVEEHSLKDKLTKRIAHMEKDISQLVKEISNTLSSGEDNPAWIDHYRQFENLSQLSRSIVVNLIRYIEIKSKIEIIVHFNDEDKYQDELVIAKGFGYEETRDEYLGFLQVNS